MEKLTLRVKFTDGLYSLDLSFFSHIVIKQFISLSVASQLLAFFLAFF